MSSKPEPGTYREASDEEIMKLLELRDKPGGRKLLTLLTTILVLWAVVVVQIGVGF